MNELQWNMRKFCTSRLALKKDVKWSNDKVMTDLEERKKIAETIKKLNWESKNLYGPMLETGTERRQFLKTKRATVENAVTYSEVFHIKEAGFKDLDEFTTSSERTVQAKIKVAPSDHNTLRESTMKTAECMIDSPGDCDEFTTSSKTTVKANCLRESNMETAEFVIDNPRVFDNVFSENGNAAQKVSDPIGFEGDSLRTVSFASAPNVAALNPNTPATHLLKEVNAFPLLDMREDVSSNEFFMLDVDSRELLLSKSSAVSTILQKTMSVESLKTLERWRNKMVESLGEEGFQEFQQEMFRVGSCLHRCLEDYLSRKSADELQIEDSIKGYWRSLQPVLGSISEAFLLEMRVQHPVLQYRGVLDGVVNYRGTKVLIEWTTSRRPKPRLNDLYDKPLQAAAYVGALNYSGILNFQVSEVLVVVAYPCGTPAHVHFLNKNLCQHYWNLWLQRFMRFLSSG